jgi:hypothetical protein
MKNIFKGLFAVAVVLTAASVLAHSAGPSAFERLMTDYEAIRQALLHDGMEGVAEHARAIEETTREIGEQLAPGPTWVSPEKIREIEQLLPSIRESSSRLANADTIEEARGGFGDLSRHLVRYRQMGTDSETAVAFCSMAQKVWLQPKGEIGNPYYGQSMARCGEFVSE